ncbi:Lrp/AsnC family transcriptional regulator [Klugiella sp. YN-L-19]|uniref:Lrp/AsnC family transcriptional regulator n=1 Tax=Ruicaihuangia caeni TaxID=3042517 RepID=A0AAW6T1F5_9MICO|nr:Lrp/AsnC family transcriptional regulator [Klugiella sp. YN-L-19]
MPRPDGLRAEDWSAVDSLDQTIVNLLKNDPRRSFSDLAAHVALSPDAVRVRVNRLVDDGKLRLIGVVEPESLGYRFIANVAMKYAGDIAALARVLRQHERVTFLASTVGRTNVFAEIAASDDDELATFVAEEIAVIPGVSAVEVTRTVNVYKWKGVGWRPNEQYADPAAFDLLDDLDIALLRQLVLDPRAKVSKLADVLDSPYAVVRRKCAHLFASGVITAVAITERVVPDGHVLGVVQVASKHSDETLRAIAAMPEASIVTRTVGKFSGVIEVNADTPAAFAAAVDRITAHDDIFAFETLMISRSLILPMPWRFRSLVSEGAYGTEEAR